MQTSDNKMKMEEGKIYFISFGSQTQLIVRYKRSDTCNHYFFDSLHYWNSFETYHRNNNRSANYCVTSGIQEIRPATLPEKHALIKFEIENGCI